MIQMDSKRILIIDDEVDFTYLLKLYFEKRGCRVEVAHNIRHGLEALESTDPDVIFLDNNLPDGSGWEKAAFILNAHPTSALYLMSGATNFPIGVGNLTILEKPFSIDELEHIVFAKRA
jgi:two-component system OmpR family response regulator